MLGGDGDVVGLDPDTVQGLHAQHVAVAAAVGEDAGVGDAEPLEVVGDEGGGRGVQRQVEVDGVEAGAVEEVVALGGDRGLEVGAGDVDGDQRQVVVGVDLDVQLGPLGQLALGRRLGERAAQLAQLQRLADDLAVALGRVDRALVAVVQLGVEERRRLAPAPPAPAASLETEAGIQPSRKPVSCAPSSTLARWL